MTGPVPGTYADLLLQASEELQKAIDRPVSAAAAAHAWPELANMGRHLVFATRPYAQFADARPETSQVPPSWVPPRLPQKPVSRSVDPAWALTGAWTLDDIPMPARKPAKYRKIENEARPLLRAAHFMGAAGDLAATVRATQDWTNHDLVPACRQAQALLAAAGRIVVQATWQDLAAADMMANASLTVAECSRSIMGNRLMHSQFDTASTSPWRGVNDPLLRDLSQTIDVWTKAARSAMRSENPSNQGTMIRVATIQQRLMSTTARLVDGVAVAQSRRHEVRKRDLPPRSSDIAAARARMQTAANSWRRPRHLWLQCRVPGPANRDLIDAAQQVHEACCRIAGSKSELDVYSTIMTAKTAVQSNLDISQRARNHTVYLLSTGLVLGRTDQLTASTSRLKDAARRGWVPVGLRERQAIALDSAHQRTFVAADAAVAAYRLDRCEPTLSASAEVMRVGSELAAWLPGQRAI